jgi:hypothetical protein
MRVFGGCSNQMNGRHYSDYYDASMVPAPPPTHAQSNVCFIMSHSESCIKKTVRDWNHVEIKDLRYLRPHTSYVREPTKITHVVGYVSRPELGRRVWMRLVVF